MNSTQWLTFVPVAPGLEPVLAEELGTLVPGKALKLRGGGVELRVDLIGLMTIARRSRIAESVRVRIARFEARDFRTLEAGLAKIPWDAYLARGSTPTVRVRARRSKLIHSDAIAERVVRALERRGSGPGGPAPTVHVRLEKDRVQVSIEAADELLHQRGWRTDAGAAPLRENLAAACLALSGWQSDRPLWDPFCGSGTLIIEGLARREPAALRETERRQIQHWPIYDSEQWDSLNRQHTEAGQGGVLLGTDRDPQAIARAQGNAERAGPSGEMRFEVATIGSGVKLVPEGAAIVTNTPYGKRLGGGQDLLRAFRDFGVMLTARPDLGPVVALVGHDRFERETGLPWTCLAEFPNRGTRVRLVRLTR